MDGHTLGWLLGTLLFWLVIAFALSLILQRFHLRNAIKRWRSWPVMLLTTVAFTLSLFNYGA